MPVTTSVNVGNSWMISGEIYVNVAGVWRRATEAYANVGGVWKLVHTDISLSSSSNAAIAPLNGLQTPAVTVTAIGGSQSYSYNWSRTGGSTLTSISSTTGQTVFWTVTSPKNVVSIWQCVATDSVFGHTSAVTVTCEFSSTA